MGKKEILYLDNKKAARHAGLKYMSDSGPGITRQRQKAGFRYFDEDGHLIRDAETLVRIKSLGIPPAWEEVWISPHENSHIQATGIDAKGRKQYRYHPSWSQVRGEAKFDRLADFGTLLPKIRKQVAKDLILKGCPKEKVVATIIYLMEKTYLRIGNIEYEKQNQSYGLTTLLPDHISIRGPRITIKFRAKSGKDSLVELEDSFLVKQIKGFLKLKGGHIFCYKDADGKVCEVTSMDVNNYLKEITGKYFTAKDFRTWGGTMAALEGFKQNYSPDLSIKRQVNSMLKFVAERLKNTVTVCRKYYVHPRIIHLFEKGKLMRMFEKMKNFAGERLLLHILDERKKSDTLPT